MNTNGTYDLGRFRIRIGASRQDFRRQGTGRLGVTRVRWGAGGAADIMEQRRGVKKVGIQGVPFSFGAQEHDAGHAQAVFDVVTAKLPPALLPGDGLHGALIQRM